MYSKVRRMSFKELIGRRRRQLLVHSYIYYRMNTNIISDDQWDAWANELIQLQTDHPKESAQAPLFEEFKTFDGHTGFDLPLHGNYLERVSQRIVRYKPKDLCYYKNVPKIYKEEPHMAKKAKWLEESTTLELLLEVEKVTEDKRALRAINELKERAPEDVQGPVALFKQIIELAEKGIEEYQTEVEEIAEFEEEPKEEVIEEEELEDDSFEISDDELDGLTVKELRAMARELEVFERGMKKAELIEAISGVEEEDEFDDEEVDDEEIEEEEIEEELDDEEEDLEDLRISELRTIARELGVFERGMKRDELIDAIEEAEEFDDEEEFDEEELIDYEDMTLKELKSEARERGIRVTRKMDEDDIIDLLEEDDEI